ncbi:vesicular glutamate transporter 3-like [Bradysia coprophila]|uniref:vesicular glutamate transporter 3-like n=1 Tax=Bradysia coprophila TaxID=38358 RepID=UPI00187D99EC|nr:vesicular glutamate transporter 3-like [Bradysia coprophila]XP_037040474.1 vesicular glutamate transporter 3-like [Bradysia coprophila]
MDARGHECGLDEQRSPISFDEIERPPLRRIDKCIRAQLPCFSARYTVAVMTFFAFLISFGIRCNYCMVKLAVRDNRYEDNNFNRTNWESVIDSSFFWGYLVTQIPGGFLTSFYPSNRIFGAAIIASSICNLFIPLAIDISKYVLIVVRFIQGAVEGVTYPALYGIWRFWAPPLERSRLVTIALSGSYAGVVVGLPVSGYLAYLNWRAPFYFHGIVGMLWFTAFFWLVFEKPRKHPTIDVSELNYIEKSLGKSVHQAMPSIPWQHIIRSPPAIAIVVANFCRSWCFYMLVLYQSAYLKQIFAFDTAQAGLVGALPYLSMAIIIPFGGVMADYLRKSGAMTTTGVRKLFNCGGFGFEALFLVLVAFSNTAGKALTFLTFAVAFSGFAKSGYNVNCLDIAPRYASILMGISNTIGTLAVFICPIVIDHIVEDRTPWSWSNAFLITACVHLFGIVFYGIFASGELQHWAEPPVEEKQDWSPTKAEITEETAYNGTQADMLTNKPTNN